jgi:hypothetical protein
MFTGEQRTSSCSGRRCVKSIRRAAVGAVVAIACPILAVSPAAAAVAQSPAAAASQDGTSNTIQYSLASAVLDQAHHRVIVKAPALTAGRHFATIEVVGPQLGYVLSNVMVESIASTSTSLALNYTKITYNTIVAHTTCASGASQCLIEEDGIYPPFS